LQPRATAALALLAFNLGYGAALSMLEDQVSAMFFGAAAGLLWQLHQIARAGAWTDPFERARARFRAMQPPYAPVGTQIARVR
jgi:hypothetical protein